MMRIGILSDTHGYLHPDIPAHLADCDEVWHAGDVGDPAWFAALEEAFVRLGVDPVLRGVHGNIDGRAVQDRFPETLCFTCESVRVLMRHIGGYPGRYAPGIAQLIRDEGARLFISGHSHILKVMYDERLNCLHINPGAAGQQGWHKVKTLVKLTVDGDDMRDCQVIELEG